MTSPNAYGAARRKLGIFYVGAIVTFCATALLSDLPVKLYGQVDVSATRWFANLLVCVAVFEVMSLPFDLAGYRIERKFSKTEQPFLDYMFSWSRAAFKHGMLLLSCIFFFTFSARVAGLLGVVMSAVVVAVFFVWKQAEMTRFLSDVSFEEPSQALRSSLAASGNRVDGLVIARSRDAGFTGGIIGLPRHESLVIPGSWFLEFSQDELRTEISRRRAALSSGSRSRGVVFSILFVTAGVAISAFLTASCYKLPLDSTAGIVTTSLFSTLWSFIGLLVLPSINQRAVIYADQLSVASGVSPELLAQTIRRIDEKMECETVRSDGVQFVFHPIPTPGRRLTALAGKTGEGAWNIARYSIWLSLVGMGLLGRAVHCNAGRPELWCMLPAD
jgi:hypothetical protein